MTPMPRKQRREPCAWQPLLDWIETEMHSRGQKPVDLVRASGIPFSTLSSILNCQHRPDLGNLDKLARCFARPLSQLKALAGYSEATPDRTQVAPLGTASDPELHEAGWRLHDLWPHLQPVERAWLLDYLRKLQEHHDTPPPAPGV